MLRKDKRSFVFSLLLGDGNLHIYKGKYALLTMDHGIQQADYQAWKAKLLSTVFEKDVKVRLGHKGRSVQVQISDNRMRTWKKWIYPNNHKDISKILPFLRHPELAVAIWLMDDGYVETSLDKRYPDKVYSARFRIFICDQTEEAQQKIIEWFDSNFGYKLKIKYATRKSNGKRYPYLKFTCEDSLKFWSIIREFVLQFKSMQYKFRSIEHLYQFRVIQRQPGKYKLPDDIVQNP